MHFILRNIPIAGRFEPGKLERQDVPLYPPLALREALVNALCHRDYTIAGGAIFVAIYDDRLEVTSLGLLPPGITVADLKRDAAPRLPFAIRSLPGSSIGEGLLSSGAGALRKLSTGASPRASRNPNLRSKLVPWWCGFGPVAIIRRFVWVMICPAVSGEY